MAAAARPPGISDARVPCPRCGGLIHPVAGRCKHCKEDLTPLRAARPQASAPLPSLVATAVPVVVPAHEASQPILPPRPTDSSTPAQRPDQTWRSWPVLVIIVALLAIATAVTIMVWPAGHEAGKHALQPPPAPERMETDPLPPPGAGNHNGADPWSQPHGMANPQPAPRHLPDPLPIDPPQPQQQPDDTDVFGSIGGGGGLGTMNGLGFLQAATQHACNRLKSCPNVDSMATAMCEMVAQMPQSPAPTCDAATRCFAAIDQLDCASSGMKDPQNLIFTLRDCTTAAMRC